MSERSANNGDNMNNDDDSEDLNDLGRRHRHRLGLIPDEYHEHELDYYDDIDQTEGSLYDGILRDIQELQDIALQDITRQRVQGRTQDRTQDRSTSESVRSRFSKRS